MDKLCRLCDKEGFIFCDIKHPTIQKISKLIPNLININDEGLKHINKVCTKCYQTAKMISHTIEDIQDIQKILKIENQIKIEKQAPPPAAALPAVLKQVHSIQKPAVNNNNNNEIAESIKRKLKNLEVKKVFVPKSLSPIVKTVPPKRSFVVQSQPSAPIQVPTNSNDNNLSPSPSKKRAYMCISCSEKFNNYEKLQTHNKTCTAKTDCFDDMKCFCGETLNSKLEFENHVQTMHQENKQKHVCTVCNKVFSQVVQLEYHMNTHKREGLFVCQLCKTKFNSREDLKKHREGGSCNKVNEI